MLVLVGAIVGLTFAAFVWPTLYRYDHAHIAGDHPVFMRMNRLTGKIDVLTIDGWARVRDDPLRP